MPILRLPHFLQAEQNNAPLAKLGEEPQPDLHKWEGMFELSHVGTVQHVWLLAASTVGLVVLLWLSGPDPASGTV